MLELLEQRAVPSAANIIKQISFLGQGDFPVEFAQVVGGPIVFPADDSANGQELWRTDGTNAGTFMVADINKTPSATAFSAGSGPALLTPLGAHRVFFTADDGVNGRELWQTDGTTAGTVMVANINPNGSANPENLTVVGDRLYFTADDGSHGRQLWATFATGPGAEMVATIQAGGTQFDGMTAVGTTLFFATQATNLWDLDVGSSTPQAVPVLPPFATMGTLSGPLTVGSADSQPAIYFRADGTGTPELWTATTIGARPVINTNRAGMTIPTNPTDVIQVANKTFFLASDPINGQQLWQTQGTAPTTSLTKVIQPGGTSFGVNDSGIPIFTPQAVLNDTLYFAARDPAAGIELFSVEAQTGSVTQVTDINLGAGDSRPAFMTAFNNRVYFVADDGSHGRQLWSIPPARLEEDLSAAGSFGARNFFSSAGTLYFTARSNAGANLELWKLSPDQQPTPQDDTANVIADSHDNSINVLGNDTDPDNDPLHITQLSTPEHGTVNVAGDGVSVLYTPASGYVGTDSFTYVADDGRGGATRATVAVTVASPPPIAHDDTATVISNSVNNAVDVLSNDTTTTGGPLTVTGTTPPPGGRNGIVTITPDGSHLLYSPRLGFRGIDTFTYTIADNHGGTATASVNVTVTNQVPHVADLTATVISNSIADAINVLGTATDPEGDALTVQSARPASGTATVSADGRQVLYTPPVNFRGVDRVAFTVSDGHGGTATATILVTVTNQAPHAVEAVATVAANSGPTAIAVLVGASDPEADSLQVVAVTTPAHGTATVSSDGTQILYRPAAGYSGSDAFSYTISDGQGGTAQANVTITVKPAPAPTMSLVAPRQISAVHGVASFRGKLQVRTNQPKAQMLIRISTSHGVLKTRASGVKITGNSTRGITLSGSSAALNSALANMQLILGRTHGSIAVTLIVTLGKSSRRVTLTVKA